MCVCWFFFIDNGLERDRKRYREDDLEGVKTRSHRSSRSYREWEETPSRVRDEPPTPKFSSKGWVWMPKYVTVRQKLCVTCIILVASFFCHKTTFVLVPVIAVQTWIIVRNCGYIWPLYNTELTTVGDDGKNINWRWPVCFVICGTPCPEKRKLIAVLL